MMMRQFLVSLASISLLFYQCLILSSILPESDCLTSSPYLSSAIKCIYATNRRYNGNDKKYRFVQQGQRCDIVLFDSVEDKNDFLDVEFERTAPESIEGGIFDADGHGRNESKSDTVSDHADENNGANDAEDEDENLLLPAPFGVSASLIDVSLETGDPRWKKYRVPFCRGDEYIDCKLAFMVDLEGRSYGIAVPFEDSVAIVIQEPTKTKGATRSENKNSNSDNTKTNSDLRTMCIDPDAYHDNKEYAELMEIFAAQVKEQLGEEFSLRKTPKVLTISGGLDKITNDWQDKVVTKPFQVNELLEVTKTKNREKVDDDVQSFYEFMRSELGDEEFDKTMNIDDNDIEAELNDVIKYFDVPGAHGTNFDNQKDVEGIQDLVKSIANDVETGEISDAKDFITDTENAALKLLGYTFRESGKSYFLVKPLKPYTLVGRHIKDEENFIRFELLTPEEEKVIIPKLEEICREDLEANGLAFLDNELKI